MNSTSVMVVLIFADRGETTRSNARGLSSPVAFGPCQTTASVRAPIDLVADDIGLLPQLRPEGRAKQIPHCSQEPSLLVRCIRAQPDRCFDMGSDADASAGNAPAAASHLLDEYRDPVEWLAHHGHHELRRTLLQAPAL